MEKNLFPAALCVVLLFLFSACKKDIAPSTPAKPAAQSARPVTAVFQ